MRDYLAWSSIVRDADELNMTAQQGVQAAARARQATETVDARLTGAYTAGLVPVQPDPSAAPYIAFQRIPEGAGTLAERVSEKLRRGQELSATYAPANIRMALNGPLESVWASGHITFGQLWDLYSRFPYLDRLRDRRVLEEAVLAVGGMFLWQTDGFALAQGYYAGLARYEGLWLPGDIPEPSSVTDATLLVRPDRAVIQRAAEEERASEVRAAAEHGVPGGPSLTTARVPADGMEASAVAPPRVLRRFYGTKALNPQRYAGDFAKINQEVIEHLAAVDGVDLEVRLEISAVAPEGFDEHRVRTVRENASQLGFEQSGFEES